MTRRIALLIALALPGLALAEVVWKSDFETGDLSQWDKTQQMSADRLAVVQDNIRGGTYALRSTVIQGDDPINASGNRNEVVKITNEKPGSEYFYSWSTLFPDNYPSENKWQLFTQWHQAGCCGSPPLEFYVTGEQINLRVGGSSGKVVWTAPLTRGNWNDFILHVKWSENPSEGFVELWHQGQLVLPKAQMATQFDKTGQYLKLGLYRDESIASVGEVFHDSFIMGTTMADVAPQAAVASTEEPPEPGTDSLVADPFTVPGEEPSQGVAGGASPAGCSALGTGATPFAALLGSLGVLSLLARRRKALRVQKS